MQIKNYARVEAGAPAKGGSFAQEVRLGESCRFSGQQEQSSSSASSLSPQRAHLVTRISFGISHFLSLFFMLLLRDNTLTILML